MASYNKFNIFVQDLANKQHNLSSDTFNVGLTNGAPVATNTTYNNLTDISAGNGYTAGGSAVSVTSSTQTSGTEKWLVAALVFTATGTIGPFRYAVLYNFTNGGTSGKLIAWWDYGSSVTLNNGDTFTVGFDQTNGVLQIA